MASRKNGSRPIVVDHLRYRWRIRQKPSYGQALAESGMVIAVEREPGNCDLAIHLSARRPDNWLEKSAAIVTPKDVAQFIRMALDLGWTPSAAGSTFHLNESDVPRH